MSDSRTSAKGTRKEIYSWIMYDWANSAYSTLAITILVAYIQNVVFPKSEWGTTGGVVWAWGISLSMFCAGLLSPICGALADARSHKHRWLSSMAILGSLGSIVLALLPPSQPWLVVAAFIVTSFFFELSLGFYNSFLPELADETSMNRVSAWGFGMGYIGGGLAGVLAALFLLYGETLGVANVSDRLRICLGGMGTWWGLFSLPAILLLRDRAPPRNRHASLTNAAKGAFGEVGHTLLNIRRLPMLALFLLGFLFYNDGVQTVISQASTFAIQELKFEDSELLGLILMIQFLAFPGAMLVGYLSDRYGQKPVLYGCLAIWIVLLASAYFLTQKVHLWILGVLVAMVMGGTQSVSRAIMGLMTPPKRTAEFFGFFNLSGKATSFMGTFLFGLIFYQTGSAKLAIVSLLIEFIIGLCFIYWINIARGKEQALADNNAG